MGGSKSMVLQHDLMVVVSVVDAYILRVRKLGAADKVLHFPQ